MKLQEFSEHKDFEITVSYRLMQNHLTLEFLLKGSTHRLFPQGLPQEEIAPIHSTDLWKKTCFECFFFEENSPRYYELNFNPFFEYDLLSFGEYRKPADLGNAPRVTSIRHKEASQDLTVIAGLSLPKNLNLLCSPTAILVPVDSPPQYFALKHGPKPDFHLRQTIENSGFQLLT